jgi:isoaspartyl peptidase/L-asparaginase-like protein (Ntn-hydrolase superfamily)
LILLRLLLITWKIVPSLMRGAGLVLQSTGRFQWTRESWTGKKLDNGAVGCISEVKNPISFARVIMERTDHTLVVGPEADKLAKAFRLKKLRYIDITDRTRRFNQLLLNF